MRHVYRWASNALLLPIALLWCLACALAIGGEYAGGLCAKAANRLADVSDRWHMRGKAPVA